ncbi:MAG: GtrA family protein [bacterium]|nr:GtrA family protein [bacterium]
MRIAVTHYVEKHQQVARFLVTGGIAFTVNISTLYVLTDILHIYYLVSTTLAFLASFSVSFLMQKFWTFKDHSRDQLHVQFSLYLILQVTNLGFNVLLIYMFVEYLHLWYILSQTIIALGLAVISFVVNKKYIFKARDVLL